MANPARGIYNAIFRRNPVFLGAVFLGAFGFEIAFDTTTNGVWNYLNRGRQWHDIRDRYVEQEE